jgi:hypothetical protein
MGAKNLSYLDPQCATIAMSCSNLRAHEIQDITMNNIVISIK